MNCQDFEKLVIALARNQLMEAAIREQSLAHAEVCGQCGTRLGEEEALLSGINAVVAEIAGEGAPARVEAVLLAAFRGQEPATDWSIVMTLPKRYGHSPSWRLGAVAAGVLILISVVVIFWRSASSHEPQQKDQAVLPIPATDGPQATPPKPAESPVGHDQGVVEQRKNGSKRLHSRAAIDQSDEAELVTQLFALREGEYLSALESLQLVRVELPGSALSELGLLIDPETANESVKADVLLGQDGLARAIRFVR